MNYNFDIMIIIIKPRHCEIICESCDLSVTSHNTTTCMRFTLFSNSIIYILTDDSVAVFLDLLKNLVMVQARLQVLGLGVAIPHAQHLAKLNNIISF